MDIRIATLQDHEQILSIYLCAFPQGEGELVAKLAIDLLSEKTTPPVISFVAEIDGILAGHIAFSPATLDDNNDFQGYILAPLGVRTTFQKRRFGSKLVQHGMQHMSAMGVNIVFVYGDPKYYGRFGFTAEVARPYTTPYRLQYPFGWQGIVLNESKIKREAAAITCVTSLRDPKLW